MSGVFAHLYAGDGFDLVEHVGLTKEEIARRTRPRARTCFMSDCVVGLPVLATRGVFHPVLDAGSILDEIGALIYGDGLDPDAGSIVGRAWPFGRRRN